MKQTKRPVYNAQSHTWAVALKLLKIDLPDGRGLATRGNHVLHTFRAFPKYRDQYAKAFRGMVALSVKMERLEKRINHPN